MALDAITWARRLATITANETDTLTPKVYENGTNTIFDFYGTINSAIRLYYREVKTPEVSGGQFRVKTEFYRYTGTFDNTLNVTDLASATTTPFTLAEGTIYKTEYSEWIDLDAAHTAAGDARG
jgi:hypothetical protein